MDKEKTEAEKLREELEEAKRLGEKGKDEKPAFVPRSVWFRTQATDPETGEILSADLNSVIPDGNIRSAIARMAAKKAGVAWDQLPAGAQSRFWALATVSGFIQNLPDWAIKRMNEHDNYLFSLYQRVEEHYVRHFRDDVGAGNGAPGGGQLACGPLRFEAPGGHL